MTNLQASGKSGIIKLEWTSPGDDLYHGNATNLEVRFHEQSLPFASCFQSGIPINESHLVTGTLQPLPGGNIQEIHIKLAGLPEGPLLYLALRAYDENGNGGEVSNMASVKINQLYNKTSTSSIFALVAYPIAGLTIIIFTIISTVSYRQRRSSAARNSYSPQCTIQINFKTLRKDSSI